MSPVEEWAVNHTDVSDSLLNVCKERSFYTFLDIQGGPILGARSLLVSCILKNNDISSHTHRSDNP